MLKKIICALLELATIGGGTYIFVSTIFDEDYIDHESAGIGAFLIALGLLVQNWRTTLFKDPKIENNKAVNRTINTLLLIVLSLAFLALSRRVNIIDSKADDLESGMDDFESRFDDTENRLENVESLEERLEKVERVSHYHY